MSFEQDPSEQADISGADLAILVDELKRMQVERDVLAVQYAFLRQTLDAISISSLTHARLKSFVDKALNLPNPSEFALLKLKESTYRECQHVAWEVYKSSNEATAFQVHEALREAGDRFMRDIKAHRERASSMIPQGGGGVKSEEPKGVDN